MPQLTEVPTCARGRYASKGLHAGICDTVCLKRSQKKETQGDDKRTVDIVLFIDGLDKNTIPERLHDYKSFLASNLPLSKTPTVLDLVAR